MYIISYHFILYLICLCINYFYCFYLGESEEILSTVGIDQDLWCYAKNMDTERGISNMIPITFYAWDFAGQVG